MWYYTKFEISYDGPEDAVYKARKEIENEYYDEIGFNFDDESKWYDYDKDMTKFSTRHPEVTFTIMGTGEDSFDYWKHVFKNWADCRVEWEIVYPEITESDLIIH